MHSRYNLDLKSIDQSNAKNSEAKQSKAKPSPLLWLPSAGSRASWWASCYYSLLGDKHLFEAQRLAASNKAIGFHKRTWWLPRKKTCSPPTWLNLSMDVSFSPGQVLLLWASSDSWLERTPLPPYLLSLPWKNMQQHLQQIAGLLAPQSCGGSFE